MKKLDHAILLTAMDVVSRLGERKIDYEYTIKSFVFSFPKLPENIKTAAQFNEYVEGKVIPGLYNNVLSRFSAIATRYLESDIYPNTIPDGEVAKIKAIFNAKIDEINAEILDANSGDLKYYNCDLEWLGTPEEKLSCSYYLRSSLTDCVRSIFKDILDIITDKNVKVIPDPIHYESEPVPETPSNVIVGPRDAWDMVTGNYKAPAKTLVVNTDENQAPQAASDILGITPTGNPTTIIPGFLSGSFVRSDKKQEETKSEVVKQQSEQKKDDAKKETTQQPKETPKAQAAKKAEKEAEHKAEEAKVNPEQILNTPVESKMDGTPKIELQIPTPNEIQDMVSKPAPMVNFDAPLVNPKYTDPLITKHFLIGMHVIISQADLEFFQMSLLTAAAWIEDYEKENNIEVPMTFAVSEFINVYNYTLVRTGKIDDRFVFLDAQTDPNYVVIKVENDSYEWYVKDANNQLVIA